MSFFRDWEERLCGLAGEIRRATRSSLLQAVERGALEELARPRAQGAGDWTFGLDLPSEAVVDRWFRSRGREGPLSVFTEDRGWRHLGPGAHGGQPERLSGFDHGGPRIAIDPIDGTRNLMADLRSAWTAIAFAPPGADIPRLADVALGVVAEIPPTNAARFRMLCAHSSACRLDERSLEEEQETLLGSRTLRVDRDARVQHGYFPFFRYKPDLRPALAELEAAFFARLERLEGADLRSIYDDQYISNAGQLVLLALGTYRMVVDARALVARRLGVTTVTSKPYDVAGAILCARAAGAVITAADGSGLDFPLDATTPVDMVGYANEATRTRLEPHWLAVLEQVRPGPRGR